MQIVDFSFKHALRRNAFLSLEADSFLSEYTPFHTRGETKFNSVISSDLHWQYICYLKFVLIDLEKKKKKKKRKRKMSQGSTKPTIRLMWPAKTQISLYIHPL